MSIISASVYFLYPESDGHSFACCFQFITQRLFTARFVDLERILHFSFQPLITYHCTVHVKSSFCVLGDHSTENGRNENEYVLKTYRTPFMIRHYMRALWILPRTSCRHVSIFDDKDVDIGRCA